MKNIILLITDTFRYDNLGQRAERPVRTPELDRFSSERASEVTGFYAGSFPTIPHRTDVATGVLGWPHYPWQPIDRSGPNHVAGLLNEEGYTTQLICDCPHLFKARFHDRFDAAFQHRGQEGDRALLHLNDPIQTTVPPEKTRTHPMFRDHPLADLHAWHNRNPRCESELFPAMTGNTAIRWLEENYAAGPFFLWVDFFDPHEPWNAPEYLVRRYDPDYDGTPMIHPNYGPDADYTPEELRNLWAHYAAEAELVDRWVGRVLQKIDDLQLWDDSIVVVTSDHGMSVGDHERTGKSNIHPTDARFWPIYPEIGHVPFLIAGGEVPQGKRAEVLGQPIDILPTVTELAGVELDPPQPLEGKSLVPCLVGSDTSHREYVVSGTFTNSAAGDVPAKHVTPFLVNERWGFAPLGPDGKPELYDLVRDPAATTNLAADHPQDVMALGKLLVEHLTAHRASSETLSLWRRVVDRAATG